MYKLFIILFYYSIVTKIILESYIAVIYRSERVLKYSAEIDWWQVARYVRKRCNEYMKLTVRYEVLTE